eukprot:TRINITY_DN16590_c0_g1_i1.p1 TRINITY_DN16590_c0_g1~~TRINITY_DN16590_c0_g1_i1.p1  ORF type:complete len:535 (+),score=167.85 TRINITY_DN16590_c0_g1_i1:143-1747(+)
MMAAGQHPSLKEVYIAECAKVGCRTNSQLLRTLPDAPGDYGSLRELNLNLNCVGKNGVKALYQIIALCHNLERLMLADNFLTNESVKDLVGALSGHPGVECVDLSRNPISHFAGKLLSELVGANPAITDLMIQNTLINPALVKIIESKAATNRQKRSQPRPPSPPHSPPPKPEDEAVASPPSTPDHDHNASSEHAALPPPPTPPAQLEGDPANAAAEPVAVPPPADDAACDSTLPYLAEIFQLCNEPQDGTRFDFSSVKMLAEVTKEDFPDMPTMRSVAPVQADSPVADPTPSSEPVPSEQPAGAAAAEHAAKPKGTLRFEEKVSEMKQDLSPATPPARQETAPAKAEEPTSASASASQPASPNDLPNLSSEWSGLSTLTQLAKKDFGDEGSQGLASMCDAAALRPVAPAQPAQPKPDRRRSSNLRVLLQAGGDDLAAVSDLVDYCEAIEENEAAAGAAPEPSTDADLEEQWYAMGLIWDIASHKMQAEAQPSEEWSALASVMHIIKDPVEERDPDEKDPVEDVPASAPSAEAG